MTRPMPGARVSPRGPGSAQGDQHDGRQERQQQVPPPRHDRDRDHHRERLHAQVERAAAIRVIDDDQGVDGGQGGEDGRTDEPQVACGRDRGSRSMPGSSIGSGPRRLGDRGHQDRQGDQLQCSRQSLGGAIGADLGWLDLRAPIARAGPSPDPAATDQAAHVTPPTLEGDRHDDTDECPGRAATSERRSVTISATASAAHRGREHDVQAQGVRGVGKRLPLSVAHRRRDDPGAAA